VTSRRPFASSKQWKGRELQVHGSGKLIRWLLDNELVDEMNLFTELENFNPDLQAHSDSV
jgi:dihydrofolate reductase